MGLPPKKWPVMNPLPRLQKIFSRTGMTSRREAEALIREGRVTVNGRIAQLGDKADPAKDHIKLDGKKIALSSPEVYILLNKPKGTVTTRQDPEGRTTVIDLLKLKGRVPRLFPVGRLDYDAEGFLLLTNDGLTAHRLSHPSYHIPRTYRVKVKGKPTLEHFRILSRGIALEDGRTAPCKIVPWKETEENLWVTMVLYEGRNRQVKRMWEKMGYPVLKLKREGFAGLNLGRLKPGEYRPLRPSEIQKLKRLTEQTVPQKVEESFSRGRGK